MSNNITFTSTPYEQTTVYTNAGGTVTVDLMASSSVDMRIYGILAQSTDSVSRIINLRLTNGPISYQLALITIAANAGNTTAIALTDIFNHVNVAPLFQTQIDANSSYYFNIPAGWKLQGSMQNNPPTAGSTITVKLFGELYG